MTKLVQSGFDALFIPFSSMANWMERYPHACPYMECDEEGIVKGIGIPYFQYCINTNVPKTVPSNTVSANNTSSPNSDNGGPNNTAFMNTADSTNNAISANNPNSSSSDRPTKRQKKHSNKSNDKKKNNTCYISSELHLEIYNYFSWLHSQLTELNKSDGGRKYIRNIGISMLGMQHLVTKMESTFRNVGEFSKNEKKRMKEMGAAKVNIAKENNDCGRVLLQHLTQRNQKRKSPPAIPREIEKHDFEDMFSRLVLFKHQKGHMIMSDQYHQYKDDDGVCLGEWVTKIRRRKKELRAQNLEVEDPFDKSHLISLPVSPGRLGLCLGFDKVGAGAVITAMDPACTFRDQIEVGDRLIMVDGNVITKMEDLSKGQEKKEVRVFEFAKKYHNTYLSLERVERLESIGFRWSTNINTEEKRPWEDMFLLLTQFKETHKQWPKTNEKWEGIGKWVIEQRRDYARTDRIFMPDRLQKLNEIGFPFQHRNFNWEISVKKLTEFHRVHSNFNVPHPEETLGLDRKEEPEFREALRFHKWVHVGLPKFYRNYKNGKQSNLNHERMKQLSELGFVLEESKKASVRKKSVAAPTAP